MHLSIKSHLDITIKWLREQIGDNHLNTSAFSSFNVHTAIFFLIVNCNYTFSCNFSGIKNWVPPDVKT